MIKKIIFIIVLLTGLIFLVSACGSEPGVLPEFPEGRNSVMVGSIEEASEFAGYKIATPSFIPDGFVLVKNIRIFQLGLSGITDPAKFSRNVEIRWNWLEDDSVKFRLLQSSKKFSVGGAEPAEVCGVSGQRGAIEADEEHNMPERLTLGWSDGSLWYSFYGTLSGPLDEEILIRIACSVEVEQ